MNTRLEKRDVYSKEQLHGIAARCDWFVHNGQVLAKTKIPKTIFISSHRRVTLPFFITRVLPILQSPVVLVIASEDYTFPSGLKDARYKDVYAGYQLHIWDMINNPLILHIFVENLDTIHPKLTPIPLGILAYTEFQPAVEASKLPISFDTRHIDVYCRSRIHGPDAQWDDRRRVDSYCKTAWSSFTKLEQTEISSVSLYEYMGKSKFCICVHGGGIDPSPKAWEAILCGAIPILEHSTLDAAYSRLPVVYVDAWTPDAITPQKCKEWLAAMRPYYEDPEKRAKVLEMLYIDYWWNIIKAPLEKLPGVSVR